LSGLKLDDYQKTSRDFLLSRNFAGLFDSPGVGKTAPTIRAAHEKLVATGQPCLVTAPAYLLPNWAYEIERFAPGSRVELANGSGPTIRKKALSSTSDFILTSYNNWSAKTRGGSWTYPELHDRLWSSIVFDEGHKLRGRSSQCTKHVYTLRTANATNRRTPLWILTGTPIVNNPGDLYPLFHLWDSRSYRSYWRFVQDWCIITETPWKTEVGQLRRGMDEEWQELVGRFSLRRTLKDVPSLRSLEELHRDYFVDMPPSVKTTIRKARKEYVIEHPDIEQAEFVSGGGALYSKLRMLTTTPPTREKPKIDFVREFLEFHDEPLVVYCWYKSSARGVAEALPSTRPVTLVTGDVPTAKRTELVDAWKKEPNGVLVATISSLKEGISLTTASNVVFLEHSELPADQEQCVARLKRRGQTSLVQVHHVWARATPDIPIKATLDNRGQGLRRALISWLREE
jgi:SWI/SNF-related matrix-associated actin-dependent regulator of chromatin subfamily A-like protein 1